MSVTVALVTGAAAGIGAACAQRLAQDGMAVGVLDLDVERCVDTVKAIKDAGGVAIALGADVSKRDQVYPAVDKLRGELGPITVVVNNAGVPEFTPFEELTDDLWDFIYGVNVRGQMICTQAVLPDMKAAHWGRIVNLSSSSAQTGVTKMVCYSSSKGAVISMTRSMALEFGPYGITANNIAPGSVMGTIQSEANIQRFQIPMEALMKLIPVGRVGEVADIANACGYLCSEGAGYITGQTIGINGGRVVT
ncbi:MAG: SDR family oxidoreductase [Actinobacteria bacterium]|nr:SDR family oxidoreductase [Actinomycetota bacterium]